jgi:xylulokinase
MSYLGIDIGSSQVKAVAYSASGKFLYSSYRKYDYLIPELGAMELDTDEVIDKSFEVIRECAEFLQVSDPIKGIAASSQGEAFTMLDENGKALMNGMISGDSRAADCMDKFTQQFGLERIYQITGHTPSGIFSLPKILWIKEKHPEIFAKCKKILCFEDLLCYRLTGEAVISYPLAARTLLFDINKEAWSEEICQQAGINMQLLATPLPSGSVAAKVQKSVADKLLLTENVIFATAGHDQIIGAFGCGAIESGSAMYAAGSVECMVPIFPSKILSEELMLSNLCTYNFALDNVFASIGYSLTGSNLLEYFIREIVQDDARDYDKLLSSMPEKITDLFVIPYFTASGTPYFDVKTPACLYGWRFSTSRGELLKGLLEGVAMEMKLNYELYIKSGIKLNKLIATGGGFRNTLVVQLHADILNLPIAICNEKENGCRGAAMLAQKAAEGCISIKTPEIINYVEPNKKQAEEYQKKFIKWKEFSKTMRNLKLWQ